jgi:AraC-like DNA-binding protein
MLRTSPQRVEDTSFLFDPPTADDAKVGRPRELIFTSVAPRGPLADFVAGYWLYRCDAAAAVRERVLPTGAMGLVVDLGAGCGPLASGAQSQTYAGQTTGRTTLVGVHFHPGGAAPFFGVPAGELQDAHVPLHELWGFEAEALHERLLAAKSSTAMFRTLEAALLMRVKGLPRRDPAVALALAELNAPDGGPPIAKLAQRLGLTARRLIRLFRDEVGQAPKLYGRVRRFQQAVGLAVGDERPAWAEIAAECGYYDQSHLVHEFGELAGLTPTAFRSVWARHLAYAAC